MSSPSSFSPTVFFPALPARHALHDDVSVLQRRVSEWLSSSAKGIDDFLQPDLSLLIGPTKTCDNSHSLQQCMHVVAALCCC